MSFSKTIFFAAVASAVLASAEAQAATNLTFTDPGFETPPAPAGGSVAYAAGDVLDGVWTVGGTGASLSNATYSAAGVTYNPHSGDQALFLSPPGATAGLGGSVTYDVTIEPSILYQFDFWLGNAPGGDSTVDVEYSFAGLCVAGCSIPLSASNANVTPGGINWEEIPNSFQFDPSYFGGASSKELSITFVNATPTANGALGVAGLDDFSTSVPEPAAWLLTMVGVGALGAALRIARRRYSSSTNVATIG